VPVDELSVIQVPRNGTEVTETIIPVTTELTQAWSGILDVYRWQKKK
jgi:hypothetical protein